MHTAAQLYSSVLYAMDKDKVRSLRRPLPGLSSRRFEGVLAAGDPNPLRGGAQGHPRLAAQFIGPTLKIFRR